MNTLAAQELNSWIE